MAYIGLQNYLPPQSLRRASWWNRFLLGGEAVTFQAARPHGKRIPFDQGRTGKLANDPGTETQPHLRVLGLSNYTERFFAQQGLSRSKYAIGIFRRDAAGPMPEAPQWHSLPRGAALRLSFSLFFRRLSLESAIEQRIEGNRLVVTHQTGSYRTKVSLPDNEMEIMHRYMEFYDHATINEHGGQRTLTVFYRSGIAGAPLASRSFNISDLPLPPRDPSIRMTATALSP